MARKPYKHELKVTITFVEDQKEAMDEYCKAVKAILSMEAEEADSKSNCASDP